MKKVIVAIALAIATNLLVSCGKTPEELFAEGVDYVDPQSENFNLEKGLRCLKKAAKKGHTAATAKLGYVYLDNNSVDGGILWLNKAVESGDAEAAEELAVIYFALNDTIVTPNNAKAVEYLQKAVELDDTRAQCYASLGQCYEQGIGVPIDLGKAFAYYQRAADLNSPLGIYNVGAFYYNGQGVAVNREAAMEFFKKAAAMDFQPAKDVLKQIEEEQKRERARAKAARDNELVPCYICHGRGITQGTGFHAGSIVTCGTCGGSGYVRRGEAEAMEDLRSSIWDAVFGN